MRGALTLPFSHETAKGIIPAYAGSTARDVPPHRQTWDHPRVCGEHKTQLVTDALVLGSSPRMRGALAKLYTYPYAAGIIPAYAGSTALLKRAICLFRDHPRVCGEHTSRAATLFVILMQRNHFLQALAAPTRSFNISQRCPRLYPGSSL